MPADPSPLVGLRCDAGGGIGLGHLQRMTALARALRAAGAGACFVAPRRAWPVLAAQGVAEAGMIAADGGVTDWAQTPGLRAVVLDTLWSGNAAETATEAGTLAARGVPVAVIDSMPPDHFVAAPGLPPVDLVVTPYLGADGFRPAPVARRWLAGADHAILGPEYAPLRAAEPEPEPRLLITCGGADPEGLSAEIVGHFLRHGWPEGPEGAALGVDVVVGPLFAPHHLARLQRHAATQPALRLQAAPRSLAPLIANAALVGGRLGLVRYEAAALRRGGVWLQPGEAYREYLAGFARAGLAEVFLAGDRDGQGAFLARLHALAGLVAAGPAALATVFSPAAFEAVDARGTERVAQALLEIAS